MSASESTSESKSSSEGIVVQLLHQFRAFKSAPQSLMPQITHIEGMRVEGGVWIFTLEGLHQMQRQQFPDLTYQEFQTQIYQSNLNQQLAQEGMSVVVHQSSGKIKSSWYQLSVTAQ